MSKIQPLLLRPKGLPYKTVGPICRPINSTAASYRPSYFKEQSLIATKIVGYGLTVTGLLATASFFGTALYLELKNPTSEALPIKSRLLQLFGRIFRVIDSHEAHTLLLKAFSYVDMDPKQLQDVKDMSFINAWIDLARELASSEYRMGDLSRAAALYNKIISIPNIDRLIKSDILRLLGELHIETKDYESAIELLRQAIESAGGDIKASQYSSKISIPTAPLPPEQLIAAADTLASLYARKRDFKAAMSIFLSILRAQRTAQQLPNPPRYSDPCIEAKVMSHLGEIFWALGKKDDGISWITASKEKAEIGGRKSLKMACDLCVANASNNLGLMMENMNKLEEAKAFYKDAFRIASKLGDIDKQFDYASNSERVEKKLRSMEKKSSS